MNRLREGKIKLPNVTELELYHCKLKTNDLSGDVFPRLMELSMELTSITHDGIVLKSLKKLHCRECGSVELKNLQKTFRQLKELHMEGGTLVIDSEKKNPAWTSLQTVEFMNVIIKHKGKTLEDAKTKELLIKICPYADIKLNHKVGF